jgi:two-component system phosphate regulon sensor histidine kinase PhoR
LRKNPRYILILSIVFGYIILQFIAWEIMFVRKTGEIIELKEKLAGLSSPNTEQIQEQIAQLQEKKQKQVFMIVGEGTVFLLLLLIGVYKIKQSLDKEQELNQQQKNFFLSITHELKTPISATKLQLQTLKKHKLDETKMQEVIQSALNENERLNDLIDNLLLANRMESGSYSFKKEKVDAGKLSEEIISRYYQNELNAGELSLELVKGKDWNLDLPAFTSIVTNLVNNAIKYSFSKKAIAVKLFYEGENMLLQVKDEGAGIPNGEKTKVFNRFYRSGDEETRKTKGTGLGLYIVNFLVKHHNGVISIKDNSPQGSIFEIRFNA